jgi:CheY-like chemotaxis protein
MPDPRPASLNPQLLLEMDEELRTSLNGIIGMIELVLDTRLTAQQQEHLTLGQSSADALLSAINNLLSAAQIEAGLFELDPIPFSLRDSLGYAIGVLALRARERNLKLVSHVLEHVPDALVGDPVVLRQVIGNLIEHAARRPGSGILMLRVEKEWDEAQTVQLEFSVRRHDTGVPALHGRERPESARSALLTITTRLVEAMGGRLWVKSARGQEDPVLFSLPFGLQQQPIASPTAVEAEAVRHLPVLVVDDQAMHRHLLEETLVRWGMRPVAVESGAEAVAALERAVRTGTSFPLVLLDAAMPGMDGFEVAAKIRQHPALTTVRIMMLALAGRRGDAARCRQLGVAAYLTRPVKRADLFDAILTVLGMPPDAPFPFLVTRHSLRESARPLRVLVLDGRPRDQGLLVRVLEEDGHTVLTAATPAEARTAFEQQPIDVVFAEPRWSGLGAERVIALARERTHGEPPAVVAIATRWSAAARRRASDTGIQACLARPLRAAGVRRVLEVVRARERGT